MKRIVLGLAAALTLGTALPALTAAANAQPVYPRPATVDQREVNQSARIDQGVRSGELTRGETRRLDGREYRLDRREARMRYRDGGMLTARDHRVLERQENHDSRAIYRLKHNGRVD